MGKGKVWLTTKIKRPHSLIRTEALGIVAYLLTSMVQRCKELAGIERR